MKAEERKELEHNALLVHLNRWKEKLKGRSGYVLLGSSALVLAVIMIIRFWQTSSAAANSARFYDLMKANTDKKLEEIVNSEQNRGKLTAVWARLQKARIDLYRDGIEKVGTPDAQARQAAYAKIEEGRKLYLELVNDLKDTPSLQQEAWLACAKAEETLLGVPKEQKNDEFRGSFDKMLEYYRKAAAINPDSSTSKKYAADADKLQANRAKIEEFYKKLYTLGFVAEMPPQHP